MNNYFERISEKINEGDVEKFLVTNEAKNLWKSYFGNSIKVDWEKFKNEFSNKALSESESPKEDVLLYLKHNLERNGEVNVIAFGQLFSKEDTLKNLNVIVNFENHLKEIKEKKDEILEGINSFFGIQIAIDFEKSKESFEKCSKNGNKFAEAFLNYQGWGVEKNFGKAYEQFTSIYFEDKGMKNKETGFAVWIMGNMNEKGEGVEKNEKKARIFYELASIGGNAVAECTLGSLYQKGEAGFEKNNDKAAELFEKSFRGGYSVGMFNFGKMLEDGSAGEKDLDGAVFLIDTAAKLGFTEASIYLAEIYLKGTDDIDKNVPKALILLTNAFKNGDQRCKDKLKQLDEEGVKLVDFLEEGIKNCVKEGKCTRTFTDTDHEQQPWYECITCGIKDNKGICESCKDVCHKGHQLSEMKFSSFYCDCSDEFQGCTYKPVPEEEDLSGKHFENLFGENILNKEKESKPTQQTLEGMTVGIYFSAHWCGPCRQFSPLLVKLHEELNKEGKKFEVIFVSSDQSEEKMFEYMNSVNMPWLAVPFGDAKVAELKKKYKVSGIPKLVILNSKGLKVSEDGRGDVMKLGNDVLQKWNK